MDQIRTLIDDGPGGLPLPDAIRELYGGGLHLDPDALYSNFVASLDGVVALGQSSLSSGAVISGRNRADRFVMGLLRACASAVLVGAGTVRDEPGIRWTPEFVAADWAGEWVELRRRLGLGALVTAVVSGSGRLDLGQPAFERDALVYTTPEGARRLGGEGRGVEIVPLPGIRIDTAAVVTDLRRRGHGRVLTEGGPGLLGSLLRDGLPLSTFLTLSPVIAGRDGPTRPGLVQGHELLPEAGLWGRLRSLKAAGSLLFLRYDFERAG